MPVTPCNQGSKTSKLPVAPSGSSVRAGSRCPNVQHNANSCRSQQSPFKCPELQNRSKRCQPCEVSPNPATFIRHECATADIRGFKPKTGNTCNSQHATETVRLETSPCRSGNPRCNTGLPKPTPGILSRTKGSAATEQDVQFTKPGKIFAVPNRESILAHPGLTRKNGLLGMGSAINASFCLDPGDVKEEEINDMSVLVKTVITDDVIQKEIRHQEKSQMKKQQASTPVEKLLAQGNKPVKQVLDDLMPEAVANMLTSAEEGLASNAQPRNTFRRLFPDLELQPRVILSSVGQGDKEHMVPVKVDHFSKKQPIQSLDEDAGILDYYRSVTEPYSFPEEKEKKQSEANEADLILEGHEAQLAPDEKEDEDYDIVIAQESPSSVTNYVQLKGAESPEWFPGYLFALPDSGDTLCMKTPYPVFELGWKALSPSKVKSKKGTLIVGT